MGSAQQRGAQRIPALDGIRAIAILLVVAHNVAPVDGAISGIPLALWAVISNAGWIGVQIFFALSGFLITRILLDSKGADGWLLSFYARRFLRILPLYYALLVLIFIIAPRVAFLQPVAPAGSRSSLWYWTYMSNWIAPFGGLARSLPHVWSLAVEEQFYILWPLVVAATTEKRLTGICVAVFTCAFLARGILHGIFPDDIASQAAYSWTNTRADAIVMGGLGALVLRNAGVSRVVLSHLRLLFPATLVALLAILLVFRGLGPTGLVAELLIQPITAIMATLLVVGCVAGRSGSPDGTGLPRVIVRELSRRWMLSIGKYSYAIYIFHMPVHLLLRPYVPASAAGGSSILRVFELVAYGSAVLILSIVLAMVSWRLLEAPFLSLKRFFPTPRARPQAAPS